MSNHESDDKAMETPGLDDDDAVELSAVDEACEFVDLEAQKRLWLRQITPLLQLRSHDPDPSGRVQLAYDLMHIAACERVTRILRDDLGVDQG